MLRKEEPSGEMSVSSSTEPPQQHISKEEEVLMDQEEPEPPEVKDVQVEFWTRQEVEHFLLKEETDSLPESTCEETSEAYEKSRVQFQEVLEGHHGSVEKNFHTAELEQNVPMGQKFCNQEENCRMEQEDVPVDSPRIKEEPDPLEIKGEPEPPQVKEEQEELCISQDEERSVLEEETVTFMAFPTYEERDQSESEPDEDQHRSHMSAVKKNHVKEGSNKVEPGPSQNLIKHNICHKTSSLKNHDRLHTGEKPDLGTTTGGHAEERKLYSCDSCGKRFSHLSSLNRHKNIHTPNKAYSCKLCDKTFKKNGLLLSHIRTHNNKHLYPCEECGKRFEYLSVLARHRRSHTGEKPYLCKACGKTFSLEGNLLRHMRTRTGEKQYSCKECGKSFSQISNLSSHMMIHTGEKPFACDECGRSFNQKSNFLTHMRTHTGEKPYSCKECDRCFRQKNDLLTHMKTHT